MGSAQFDFVTGEDTAPALELQPPQTSALRQQVAERLAAHKQRRQSAAAARSEPAPRAPSSIQPRSPRHRVAAAVVERYASTPSYRAFLAEQAQRAIEEAAAAAEIAMRNAEAVAAAQQELLGELELWNAPQEFTPQTAVTIQSAPTIENSGPVAVEPPRLAEAPLVARAAARPAAKPAAGPVVPLPAPHPAPDPAPARPAGLTVRLYEDLRQVPPVVRPAPSAKPRVPDAQETEALDAEIAFRQAPVFEEFWIEPDPLVDLPANLLEFPRQLVAARKARPRLAEGPLREEITPRTAQLRIFEVEPDQICTAPATPPAAPEWTSSIRLDAHSVTAPAATPESTPLLASLLAPQTAPLSLRIMAALVDGMLVTGAALAGIAVFARLAGRITLGLPAALSAAGLFLVMHIVYQLLFFTLSDQTPGMRYARIGLCTFSDDNPTRSAMRRRILAQLIAICPLGLGLLWVFLDDDGLGWHDRISHMYQRAY